MPTDPTTPAAAQIVARAMQKRMRPGVAWEDESTTERTWWLVEARTVVSYLTAAGLSVVASAEAEWRPIESAPKDGTRVQLYRARNYAPGVLVHDMEIGSYVEGDWEDDHGGLIDQPTHWRSLPPPPEGV